MDALRGHDGETYQIVSYHIFVDNGALLEFRDEFFAFTFLNGLADNPFNRVAIRKTAGKCGLAFPLSSVDDEDVILFLAAKLVAGRLRIVQSDTWREWPGRPGKGGGDKPGKDEPPTPPASDEKTWVRFEVVDDETREPVPNVILELRLPDGRTHKAKTDGSGMIEITDLPDGTCDILYMSDADSLEVVSIT